MQAESEGSWKLLLALQMKERAVSQGMWAPSTKWKRHGHRLSLRASRRNAALLTPQL